MKVITNEILIGIEKPFSFLHISDTHLSLADEREDNRKITLAENRSRRFPKSEENARQASRIAKENKTFIAHTGDFIDFVSMANLEYIKKYTDENDCFMTAGNHEFSLYVGEGVENAEYRNQSLKKVQSVFKNNIRFSSRIVNGMNLVAIDNSYYLFEEWQLKRLKAEVEKKLPILLFLHIPLYCKDLYEFCKNVHSKIPVNLMSVPEERMTEYSEERYEQQKEDEITAKAYQYIIKQPIIKALFAGHIHHSFETKLAPEFPQFITGIDMAREIKIL